ncbi:MAG TPA: LssY C-terminal domain-containing protein [bacterium]|nr:LssY C-terminal domain-containing protein [bacterium]
MTACLALSGCATYKPHFDPNADYFQRMDSQEQEGVKVSVVGLGAKESRKTFGVNLASKHILPVWIKIENGDPKHSYFFLERAIDPEYYPAGEAAYMSQFQIGYRLKKILPPILHFILAPFLPLERLVTGAANQHLETAFRGNSLKYGWLKPGESRSGFVFVPFKVGLKEISVDLYADDIKRGIGTKKHFEFIIRIPGIRQDYLTKDFDQLYSPDQVMNIQDEESLQKYLEQLPCCTTGKKGTKNGDPINLVVIGDREDILTAFTVSKWDETEIIYWGSILKMIRSFSLNKRYEYSPVSPLYFFERAHDAAFQKARATINERMHARLWYSPVHYQGKEVWIGSVSRDIGVRFTNKTWNLMTHKIDPDIDEAALYSLSDLIYLNRLSSYGLTGGVPESTPEDPAANLTGDPYYTQGKRVVLELSKTKTSGFPDRLFMQNETPSSLSA